MNTEKKYSKISGQVIFSNIVLVLTILISPVLIALLTRVLSIADFGVYSLLTSFVALMSLLLILGLSKYIIARLPGKQRTEQATKFYAIVIFNAVIVAVLLLVAYFSPFKPWFLGITNLQAYSAEFGICLFVIFAMAMGKLFFEYYSAKERLNFANTMDFLVNKGWMFILVAIFLIFRSFTLSQVFIVWLVGVVLAVLIYSLCSLGDIKIFLKEKFNTAVLKRALWFGLPVIPVVISGWLISLSDRFILNHFMTAEAVGLYTLPYSLLGVVKTFGTSASVVILPYFAAAYNNKNKDSTKLISAAMKFGLVLIVPFLVGAAVLGKQIILIISGAKYLPAVPYLLPLLLYPLFYFMASIFYDGLVVAGQTKHAGIAYTGAAILNIILNIWWIPKIGIYGAVFSTVLSYLLMSIYMYSVFKKYCKISPSFIKFGRILIASIIMGIPIYFINPSGLFMTVATTALGGAIYCILLLVFKVISHHELRLFFSKVPVVHKIIDKIFA